MADDEYTIYFSALSKPLTNWVNKYKKNYAKALYEQGLTLAASKCLEEAIVAFSNALEYDRALHSSGLFERVEPFLQQHLNDVLKRLEPKKEKEEVCARLFEHLVAWEGRKVASVSELTGYAGDLSEHVSSVLKTLEDTRILRAVALSDPSYEIFHDLLMSRVIRLWLVSYQADQAGLTHHFFRAYAPLFPAFLRVFHGN